MFACKSHWYALRKELRDAIWREYREGQERSKRPSLRYLVVQQRAVAELAFRPHDEAAVRTAAQYLLNSERIRALCVEHGFGDPLESLEKNAIDVVLERRKARVH